MNMFDRFLLRHDRGDSVRSSSPSSCACPSCKRILDSRTYQLAAMTSLYLAIKLHTDCDHTRNKRTFKLEAFVALSRGQFVPSDICAMEQTMLTVVRWQVHPPTPMIFCSYMLATLMPNNQSSRFELVLHVIRELARYLTELAVCLGRECSGKPASQVAICAILSSMDLLTVTALPLTVRDVFYDRSVAILRQPPDVELRAVLQEALWPELLFDENNDDSRHPISMARDGVQSPRDGEEEKKQIPEPEDCPATTASPPLLLPPSYSASTPRTRSAAVHSGQSLLHANRAAGRTRSP